VDETLAHWFASALRIPQRYLEPVCHIYLPEAPMKIQKTLNGGSLGLFLEAAKKVAKIEDILQVPINVFWWVFRVSNFTSLEH